VVIYIGDLKFI